MKSLDDILIVPEYKTFSANKNTWFKYKIEGIKGYYSECRTKMSHNTVVVTPDLYVVGHIKTSIGWNYQYVYFYDKENRVSTMTIGIYVLNITCDGGETRCEDFDFSSVPLPNNNLKCMPHIVFIENLACFGCKQNDGTLPSLDSNQETCEKYDFFSEP